MRKTLREVLQTVLLALVLFSGLQATLQNYRVEGSSMVPTLANGEYLMVNKLAYYHVDRLRLARYVPFVAAGEREESYLFNPPKLGEVIVFRYPKDPTRNFVKRVIAVPGDAVEIRSGSVFVNDRQVQEPYLAEPPIGTRMERRTMGHDEFFVMGDNRLQSNDSRSWGPVPLENIIGRVWVSYWPLSQMALF